ncbi:bifunctional 3-deoxy-7-phosphoheptulonate synthase/chorismate mutase type II [Capnocytophaga genosp. AHN8471]|uniref:bifunctional 3-deoxy-7-phosphoheptulonate synthase/chorismate mutase type II n=1 Tax=Capnocytophaga genosp. AHN8471 TaxID=327574 RepID=UPI0019331CE4|nr:bifunctional 3-deoxy-7-phosphoheptulonate synthase/chorismate mutase type II [Capnocytophaga genosp. AHN8471]MBM0653528.1 bifunctional 3-deoxy-7-phosphoheptulonate synthase/chorismate mutase type II [Capnocytophaga genosp. AHN8471]MBM0660455.1 bifunctional 3-deoxy-7-phosphoheptulonate synthase/chorismate mutase type II [Capnocytophaga genosp. AHN8471]
MEITKENRKWLDDLHLNHPVVIAGPCSAETEEQVLKIAHSLKNTDVSFFRAGIWKPRTRPGMFEGVGALGLQWLQRVKEETGLKTATEVANKDHVKLALDHDIDMLWIGARSTVSPFIIQEIADELKGTDKIILVKNPVNPDLPLWIGALERLQRAGIEKLGVIHRGFSTYEKTKYRNIPEWQLVIELQNKYPNLPIICDPSHITGKRDLIFDVSQTALDLNFDGLMIETHCNPDAAWSDAAQQVTPKRLVEIMNDLRIRKTSTSEEDYVSQLGNLRSRIDIIDEQLLDLLKKRMDIADEIGTLKKANNVAILQNTRWHEILGKMILEGEQRNLSEEFVIQVFKAIHQESINRQARIVR